MRRYTVAQVRRRLAEALDGAERGEPVVIERRGVRFRLQAVPRRRTRRTPRRGLIEFVDATVEAGDWSWTLTSGGLRFKPHRRRA